MKCWILLMYENIPPYMLASFLYCENQAYLKKNNLSSTNHINITIGNIYDEENKKIKFDGFEIDEINNKEKLIIEYKKSCENKEGSLIQLLFYMYLTKNIFKGYRGKLVCIESKEVFYIKLTKEKEKYLLENIKLLMELNYFDKNLINSTKCTECSQYDYCHS